MRTLNIQCVFSINTSSPYNKLFTIWSYYIFLTTGRFKSIMVKYIIVCLIQYISNVLKVIHSIYQRKSK